MQAKNRDRDYMNKVSKNPSSWTAYIAILAADEPLQDMYVGGDNNSPATLFGTIPLPYSILTGSTPVPAPQPQAISSKLQSINV